MGGFEDKVRGVLSDTMNLPDDFLSMIPQYVAQNPVAIAPHSDEVGYDQITSNVGITGLSSAAPTAVIGGSAHPFDGNPVLAEFFCPLLTSPAVATGFTLVGLYEGSTLIAQISQISTPAAVSLQVPGWGALRFTPTVGLHTYSIKAWTSSTTGGPTVVAGVGSGGAYAPAYLRFLSFSK